MSLPRESYQFSFSAAFRYKSYGGYHNIPPVAWARWDRLYQAYRESRRINLGSPIIRA